ncbi:MAG: FAD-dependent oxidoreductase [Rhodobacteraceae bacterium]|nr:FAD-dependent oxidoreductase [Paracoccaceae bacterium]
MTTLGKLGFWYSDIGLPQTRRPPLSGDIDTDVAIVGAGYTGLWTAYYLRRLDPSLRVTVLERHFAGYGASGRNGGWLSGGFSWNHQRYADTHSVEAVRGLVRAMMGTVDEVIRVAGVEGIDADIRRCDELMVATNPAQLERLRAETLHRARWGEEARVFAIDAAETRARVNIPGVRGGMVVTGTARIQPAKLVRGLAEAVERAGATIHEETEVTSIGPGAVTTTRGVVRAPVVLRCTEGFTATLPGLAREWLPMNSAQIVTQPLPPEVWAEIGWDGHEILGDFDHTYCYCQRTREGRITVGARGVPYRFGSQIDRDGTPDAETVRRLTAILHRHFPAARGARIDHAWCGVLGVPRDWCATVGLGADGIGWAGGYVGTGVSTSNLAGRTLADLTLGRASDLTTLPWVNRRVRSWEPEPLRWLGVRAMYRLYAAADRAEAAGGPPSRLAAWGNRQTGRG